MVPLLLSLIVLATPSPAASACADCHADQHAEWRTSRHASAWTNRLMQVSFAKEPMPWCMRCHAPLAELREEGINCAVCHLRGGQILASHPPTRAAKAAHPIVHEPRLNTAAFCSDCHQFNFPIGKTEPIRESHEAMQNTFAEWRDSPAAKEGKPCQACHLRGGDHTMTGGHALERMRSAIAIDVAWIEGGGVRIEIESRGVGHNLPTGDPFRRLTIELCADRDCELPIAERSIGRTFARRGDTWSFVHDNALRPGAKQTFDLSLPGPSGRPLFWRATYRFAARGTEAALLPEDVEYEILSGSVRSSDHRHSDR